VINTLKTSEKGGNKEFYDLQFITMCRPSAAHLRPGRNNEHKATC
jgi:hypothetical protein